MATIYSLVCWGGKDGKSPTADHTTDRFTLTNHGVRDAMPVQFVGGTPPAGLSASTNYYCKVVAAGSTFDLYTDTGLTAKATFTDNGTGWVMKSGYYMGLPSKTRWTYSSVEYIFDSIEAWNTYHTTTNPASAFDTHYCEIGEAFTSYQGGTALTITVPSAQNIIWTKVNGVRSDGWHSGGIPVTSVPTALSAGFVYCVNAANGSADSIKLNRYGDYVDGFTVLVTATTGVGSCVTLNKGLTGCYRMNLVGYSTSVPTRCLYMSEAITYGIGNQILKGSRGAEITNFKAGLVCANNTISGAATGMYATTGPNGFYYNNISLGNTTNWAAATLTAVEGSSNNAGLSGEAWVVGSGTRVTMATTDFNNFASNDFSPAASTSPQVNAGVNFYGYPALDIADGLRPSYEDGTDVIDIGAHEWDFGNTPPLTVTITPLVAGSTVRVFAAGTQTERASTTNSGTSYNPSGVLVEAVDITIYKDGYLPRRLTNVTLSEGLTIESTQTIDRAYAASSGLTYGTTATVNTSTKQFSLTTASTGQNWYSFWIEQYRSHADLRNKDFPLQANGPNSFSLLYGYEFDGSSSIANLSRDGIRYVNTSGTQTAVWAAILTAGVPSGARVRYQQTDGGTTQSAAVTSGNMDQLVQVYGDSTHGNFDYRGYFVAKVQEQGYDQAEADAVALYGNLEDQLYVLGLAPTANSVAAANPSIPDVTITDHGASPVTWNAKAFSITITDAGTTTGEHIMQAIRYAEETGGTFQGKDGFNWHDLVQTNGDKFKGVRGKLYGDTGATLKGVRVLRGADAHPDFTLHTADDGTTVSTTPPAQATATILANSRCQLYNVTTATELLNTFETGTGYAKTLTSGVSVGDTLRLRVCKLGYQESEAQGVWTTNGCPFIISQSTEPVYTAWGIDGSTVTEFAPDTTGHIYVESNDPDGASSKARFGAYYNYLLTTEGGIRYYYGGVTFLSTAAIRVNTAIVDLLIENVNATTALRFSDTDVRLYRDDGTTIIAPTSYSIHNDYSGVPDVVTTSDQSLNLATAEQAIENKKAAISASTLSAAQAAGGIHSDLHKVLGTSIQAGSSSTASIGY